MEMLAHSEFYKWWRVGKSLVSSIVTAVVNLKIIQILISPALYDIPSFPFPLERERQERLRSDGDDPRLITNHDSLTVTELLRRGFENGELERYLTPPNMKIEECRTSPETRRMGPKVPIDRDSSFMNENHHQDDNVLDEDKSASFAFQRSEPNQNQKVGVGKEKEVGDLNPTKGRDFVSNVTGNGIETDQEMKDGEKEDSEENQEESSRRFLKDTIRETKMKLLASISNNPLPSTSSTSINQPRYPHYSLPTPKEISENYFPPKLFSGPSNHLSLQESRKTTSSSIQQKITSRTNNSPCHYQSREFLSIPQRLEMVGRDLTRLLDTSLRKTVDHVSIRESLEIEGFGKENEIHNWWEVPNSKLLSKHVTATQPNFNDRSINHSRAGIRTLFLDHKDLAAKKSSSSFDLVAFADSGSENQDQDSSSTLNLICRKLTSEEEEAEPRISLARISLVSSDSKPLDLLDYGFFMSKSSESSTGVEIFLLLKEKLEGSSETTTYLTSISLPTLEFKSISEKQAPSNDFGEVQKLKVNAGRTHIFDAKDKLSNRLSLSFFKKTAATMKAEGKAVEYFDLEFFPDEEEDEEEEEEEAEDEDEEEEDLNEEGGASGSSSEAMSV